MLFRCCDPIIIGGIKGMKKLKVFLSIIIVLLVSGCNNSKYTKDYDDVKVNSNSLQQFPEFSFDTNEGQGYMSEGSAASENGYYYITKPAMSTTPDKFIYFYDMESQTSVPLCSNLNCNHNDSGCDAYISDDKCLGENIWYYGGRIYMIERTQEKDSLVSYDKEGRNKKNECVLSVDNAYIGIKSNTTGVACVNGGYLYYELNNPEDITDGYSPVTIYRIALDGNSKAENLATFKISSNAGGSFKFYTIGDKVYIISIQTTSLTECTYLLYEYNSKENNLKTLFEKDNTEITETCRGRIMFWTSKSFVDTDENLYYVSYIKGEEEVGNNIGLTNYNGTCILNKYNSVTKENQEIYVLEGSQTEYVGTDAITLGCCDGKYLFFYEGCLALPLNKNPTPLETSNNIVVMNSDGSIVDKIHFSINKEFKDKYSLGSGMSISRINIVGGDERYLMIQTSEEAIKGIEQSDEMMALEKTGGKITYKSNIIAVFDKKQIGTGVYNWFKVK